VLECSSALNRRGSHAVSQYRIEHSTSSVLMSPAVLPP